MSLRQFRDRHGELRAVTNHTAEYLMSWCYPLRGDGLEDLDATLVLLGAGQGSARLPTCEQLLERLRCDDASASLPIVRRLLSSFRPREMRALRVRTAAMFDMVLSLLGESTDDRVPADRLGPLMAVDSGLGGIANPHALFTLVEQHAATITALECTFFGSEEGRRAIAQCTRLESLTRVRLIPPTLWLNLTHLHTLHGVNLATVSIAEIAAALPRLQTLVAISTRCDMPPSRVAGLFEDLLPRLQKFHFTGAWPQWPATADHPTHGHAFVRTATDENTAATLPRSVPDVLPPSRCLGALHTLVLRCGHTRRPPAAPFAPARASVLWAPDEMITEWLAADVAKGGPLSRVRELHVRARPIGLAEVAKILLAAPHLRTLETGSDGPWCTDEGPHPAFVGLRHHRLRHVRVSLDDAAQRSTTPDCATRLRCAHFPRLMSVAVGSKEYLAVDEASE